MKEGISGISCVHFSLRPATKNMARAILTQSEGKIERGQFLAGNVFEAHAENLDSELARGEGNLIFSRI